MKNLSKSHTMLLTNHAGCIELSRVDVWRLVCSIRGDEWDRPHVNAPSDPEQRLRRDACRKGAVDVALLAISIVKTHFSV